MGTLYGIGKLLSFGKKMNDFQLFRIFLNHRFSLWASFLFILFISALVDGALLDITEGKTNLSKEYDIFILFFALVLFACYIINNNLKTSPLDKNKHLFWFGLFLLAYGFIGFGDLLLKNNELNNFIKISSDNNYHILSRILFYIIPFCIGLILTLKNIKKVPNTNKNKVITILLLLLYILVWYDCIESNSNFWTITNQVFITLSLIFIIKIFLTINKNEIKSILDEI